MSLALPITVFVIGLLLLVVGHYIGNFLLTLAGGLWFIINSMGGAVSITGLGWTTTLFFVFLGLMLVFDAILGMGGYYDAG